MKCTAVLEIILSGNRHEGFDRCSMDTGFYRSKSESLYLRQKQYILSKTKQVNSPDKGCTCFWFDIVVVGHKEISFVCLTGALSS